MADQIKCILKSNYLEAIHTPFIPNIIRKKKIKKKNLTFFRGPLALPSPEEDEVVDDRRAEDRDLFFKWPGRFGSLLDGSLTAQRAKK